jgi:hypothetical protein
VFFEIPDADRTARYPGIREEGWYGRLMQRTTRGSDVENLLLLTIPGEGNNDLEEKLVRKGKKTHPSLCQVPDRPLQHELRRFEFLNLG